MRFVSQLLCPRPIWSTSHVWTHLSSMRTLWTGCYYLKKYIFYWFFFTERESELETSMRAETGLAKWIERRLGDWRAPGLIPVKGMYLGCWHIPSGGVQEAADRWLSLIDVSNSLSLSLPLCTKSIKYIFLKRVRFLWHISDHRNTIRLLNIDPKHL